jgi:C-terminal processing protease CtpA/Prc
MLHAARWLSLDGMEKLGREGKKPWIAGRVGLEHGRLLEWARYVTTGGMILPLHFLALPNDPVYNDKEGGTSEPQRRELARRHKPRGNASKLATEPAAAPSMTAAAATPPSQSSSKTKPAAAAAATKSATSSKAATTNAAASAAATASGKPSVDTTLPATSPAEPTKRTRHVSFSDESEHTLHETYTHAEYARRMDPGEGFSDLHELVSYNQEKMETEQEEEVEESIAHTRLRAYYILRQGASNWGLTFAGKKHIGEQVLTEDVLIDQIAPDGAIARDGNLQKGDRVIKINGQWALSKQSIVYLMEVLATHDALDVTISRGEPLPPPPVGLSALDDGTLQDAAFEHYGLRIIVSDIEVGDHVWTRADTLALLEKRFAGAPPRPTEPRTAASAATTAAATSPAKTGKRHVQFTSAEPEVAETYAAGEYERKLDPGEGFSDLRQLFDHNNQVMEDEQQKEAELYAEQRRMHTYTVRRGPSQTDFGIKVKPLPRDVGGATLFLEGVAVSEITDGGAVARDGSIKLGDRVVKVNGQWILNHQHADFLLYELLGRANALDLTVMHGDEPLPPVPGDFMSMKDADLEDLALAHAGRRVKLSAGIVSRGDLIKLLRSRFSASTGSESAMHMGNGGAGDDDDDEDC